MPINQVHEDCRRPRPSSISLQGVDRQRRLSGDARGRHTQDGCHADAPDDGRRRETGSWRKQRRRWRRVDVIVSRRADPSAVRCSAGDHSVVEARQRTGCSNTLWLFHILKPRAGHFLRIDGPNIVHGSCFGNHRISVLYRLGGGMFPPKSPNTTKIPPKFQHRH